MPKDNRGWHGDSRGHAEAARGRRVRPRTIQPRYSRKVGKNSTRKTISDYIMSSDWFVREWEADEEITDEQEYYLFDLIKEKHSKQLELTEEDCWKLVFYIKDAHNSAMEVEDGEGKRMRSGYKDKPYTRD